MHHFLYSIDLLGGHIKQVTKGTKFVGGSYKKFAFDSTKARLISACNLILTVFLFSLNKSKLVLILGFNICSSFYLKCSSLQDYV